MLSLRRTSKKLKWTKKLCFLFSFVVLLSCSTSQNSEKTSLTTELNLDAALEKPLPNIRKDKDSKGFGPFDKDILAEGPSSSKNSALPVLGLTLAPGLYSSLAYLPVLEQLTESYRIHFIGGHGLSAIIASYIAFGYRPSLIEWKFHKFLAKYGEYRPYSKEWREELSRMIAKDFKGKRIEQAKLNLFIPVMLKNSRKIQYLTRGNLYDKLVANLYLSESPKASSFSAMTKEIFDSKKLKGLGVDFTFGLSVLDKEVRLKESDDYFAGIYSKVQGIGFNEAQELNFHSIISTYPVEIDSVTSMGDISLKGRMAVEETMQRFEAALNAFQKDLKEKN